MKPETFFDNFEGLAEAPNGVKKLRELILQLAVRGKLVAQDEKDVPASILLERIIFERKKLVKEGKIKENGTFSIGNEDVPFELPSIWKWTCLYEIGMINPRNIAEDDKEVSFIPMTLISETSINPIDSEKRRWGDVKKGFTHFAEGDIVLAKITPCFQNGKSAVMRGLINNLGAGTTELHVFRPILNESVNPEYVLLYLRSPQFLSEGIEKMTGTAGQKRVPKDYFACNPFPLPPFEEQTRIVAKVDQLMSLCDELEARQQKKRESRARINSAALDRLLAARAPGEFAEGWRRISDNFELLYDAPENVGALRKAILQLAVRGKLVEQDEKDETAYNLLKRIKTKKEQMVKENKIKKIEPLAPINKTEVPYILPIGWDWAHIGDLILSITGGGTPSKNNPQFWNGNIPWASVKDLGKSKYLETTIDYITEKGIQNSSTNLIPKGRIIICTRMGLGKIAINKIDVAINQDLKAIELPEEFNENYFYNFYITQNIKGSGMTVSGIRQTELLNMLVPVPPANEQRRIVARVDQLMSLCDELEAGLLRSQADSERLMEAVVGRMLAE